MEYLIPDSPLLSEILGKVHQLSEKKVSASKYNEEISSLNSLVDSLQSNSPPIDQFHLFIKPIHNILVQCDSSIRSILLRAIRLCLLTASCCEILLSEEIHWIVVSSLEKDPEYLVERIQALKLVNKFLEVATSSFPISFTRSLVAISNQKDDNLRRLCLELLRKLVLNKPDSLVTANGVPSLVEAILDPSLIDLSESLLISLLQAIADENSRKYIRPFLDLRTLIAPLTDLDIDASTEKQTQWKSAKQAFITIMRTWVGVSHLASDELGLPTLVKMLSDPKVPILLQEAILDSFIQLFEPIVSNVSNIRKISNLGNFVHFQSFGDNFESQMEGADTLINTKRTMSGSRLSSAKSSQLDNFNIDSSVGSANNLNSSQKEKDKKSNFLSFFTNKSPAKSRRGSNTISMALPVNSSDKSSSSTVKLGTLGVSVEKYKDSRQENEPVFNSIDFYTAFLCSALIHSKIVDSLCDIAIHGENDITAKARSLLVDVLRTAAAVFPDAHCNNLLTMPSLIKFASSSCVNQQNSSQNENASITLLKLCSDFSLASRSAQEQKASFQGKKNNFSDKSDPKKPASHSYNVNTLCEEMNQITLFTKPKKLDGRLKISLLNPIDKVEFLKQLELSRILSKEGKEPFKWDWSLIYEILVSSFYTSDRLNEALKTKWIRRLSGFFRCSLDDKAYFANLDWDIVNFQFLECACMLYLILSEDDSGINFLATDRRGILFTDIAHELESLLELSSKGISSLLGQRNFFRASACSHNMAREYFLLLGKLTASSGGRKILDESKCFDFLSSLGSHRNLDYISRLAITSLVLTDNGYLSKHLLQIWACSPSCSHEFRQYMFSIVMLLLLSRPVEFLDWGLDVLLGYLIDQDTPEPYLFHILETASYDKSILKALISKNLRLLSEPLAKNVLAKIAGAKEGIAFLKESNLIVKEIEYWISEGTQYYYRLLEKNISRALLTAPEAPRDNCIPIQLNSYSPFLIGSRSIPEAKARHNLFDSIKDHPKSNFLFPDLEGLFRLPWNIEVKLTPSQTGTNLQFGPEYLKIDTYLDISEVRHPIASGVSSKAIRNVKIKGIVLDGRGLPTAQPIANNKIISSTLLLGVSPVSKSGQINSLQDIRSARRKSFLNTASTSTSRESVSQSRRSSVTSDLADIDFPISYQFDSHFDWTHCKPFHRQGNVKDLGEGRFSVEIPGEPVEYIFSKSMATNNNTNVNHHRRRSDGIAAQPPKIDMNKPGGFVYLVEIHYNISIETGQGIFSPLPVNLFGQLAKTHDGLNLMNEYNVVGALIAKARQEFNCVLDRASSLLSLGNIGSSDTGFSAISFIDPQFVDWCISSFFGASNFSLRGAFFQTIGLISRSRKGSFRLEQLQWHSTPVNSNSAISLPRDLAQLFIPDTLKDEFEAFDPANIVSPLPFCLSNLSPFLRQGSVSAQVEVLNLIAKLPGVVPIFKESKAKLEKLKQTRPEIFCQRDVYLSTLKMMESCSFRLSVRREVEKLFHISAKIKQ